MIKEIAEDQILQVYPILNPEVHTIVGQLLSTQERNVGDTERVDFNLDQAPGLALSAITKSAGNRLPVFVYDSEGNYVRMGRTREIDELDQFEPEGPAFPREDAVSRTAKSIWLRRTGPEIDAPEVDSLEPNVDEKKVLIPESLAALASFAIAGYGLSKGDPVVTGASAALGVSFALSSFNINLFGPQGK